MQKANADTRRPLTRRQIIRNIQMLKAHFRKESARGNLEIKDLLERREALFDHLIEVTVEGEGDVIATLEYKPLEPLELR